MFISPVEVDAHDWASRQFGSAQLGDRRRTRRLVSLAATLASAGGTSIAAACVADEAGREAGYRFANNEDVSVDELVAAGGRGTSSRLGDEREFLALCDSTTLIYHHDSVHDEMGDVGAPPRSTKRGIWAHNVLLVDRQTRVPLGLLHQDYWIRDVAQRGKKHQRRTRPYEDKESYKWERGIDAARAYLSAEQQARTLFICDREADVFELVHALVTTSTRFVIRAVHNRALVAEEDTAGDEQTYLWDGLEALEPVGQRTLRVEQRGGRPARLAELALYAATMTFCAPKRLAKTHRSVTLRVVRVLEANPPEGVEALEWVLMTTEEGTDQTSVERIVDAYAARWLVEDFHKAWKSGCKVEELRLRSRDALLRVAVLLAQAAVRLIALRNLAGTTPDAPAETLLDRRQMRCLWAWLMSTPVARKLEVTKASRGQLTMRQAYLAIGYLGGWHDSQRNGRVGWEKFWQGWSKLQTMAHIAELLENDERCDH